MFDALKDPFLDDSHRAFRDTCRRFAEKEIAPHAYAWEEDEEFPLELYRKAGAAGVLGPLLPAELGGGGGDALHGFMQIEGLMAGDSAGVLAGLSSLSIALPPIASMGSDAQKQRFVTPALEGEKVAALAVTEPGAGSDVAGVATRARRDGDDWVLDGAKTYITSGVRADFVTVLARTGEDPHEGLTFFVVEKDTPGYSVSRPLKKMGWRASDTAELAFEACRIPDANRVGPEGAGFPSLMKTFEVERLSLAAFGTAGAERALAEAEAYSFERQAFGQRLWDFQALRHKLIGAGTQLAGAVALCYQVADAMRRGERVTELACRAKNLAARVAVDVCDVAVQAHGGLGYMRECRVERAYRDARILAIGGGASEVLDELIARQRERARRRR